MKTTSNSTNRRAIPFFLVFMIVYVSYIILGYLLMYLSDNNVFRDDEFPEGALAGFSIAISIVAMVVPGIAAHYVYKNASSNWYVWFCPLVLMLINVPLWLARKGSLLTFLPMCTGLPISFFGKTATNVDFMVFMDIVLVPSIIYSFCIFFARLFSRRPKENVE